MLFLVSLSMLSACGGGSGSSPRPVLELFAGNLYGVGSLDGIGGAASFFNPNGIATDSAGNVYVADSYNHTIRKITAAGMVSTLAGTAGVIGSADGSGAAARFAYPQGIATDSAGNVYVADSYNHTIRKVTPAGGVSTFAGVAQQVGFMPGALPGRLSFPQGLTVAGSSLYITSNNGVAVVRNLP